MHTYIAVLLLLVAPSLQNQWTMSGQSIDSLINNSAQKVNGFFQDQKKKVEGLFSSNFGNAVNMTDKVREYLDNQHRKIGDELNSFVETVEEKGRKITDLLSFVPDNDSIEDEERMDNPDVVLSVPARIQRNGYPCETHTITSKGYILNIHRIPSSKGGSITSFKTVILQHGLYGSSADWILNGPDKGLAYVLADAGHDVWMLNIRGNRYSREHTILKTDTKSYWNFSWHDVALHDIPAIIDYIKKVKRGKAKLVYIGHSMGTTMLFAMLSLRPEYNEQLTAGVALAPVAFMSDVKSPTKTLAPIASNVAYMMVVYGSHEFLPKNSTLGSITKFCKGENFDADICKNVIFSVCGYNEAQYNKSLLPVFLAHLGTGTSWKTVVHFSQEIEAGGKFQKFDYGPHYNKKLYGSDTPPEYDLSAITLPIKLFWAQNDLLSGEKDVRKLYDRLPVAEAFMVPDPNYNHIDYLWAKDAQTLLNSKLVETLHKAFIKGNENIFNFKLKFG